MLRELRVRNFAVVEEARLEFGPGFNVLSGETGAGKSILFEALGLLVGGRASRDVIRAGCDFARVEARFEVDGIPGAAEVCQRAGIDVEEGWLLLRRELRREGRHRAWVNDLASTSGLLRELGGELVELHGQHEHQRLLDRGRQLQMLDAFGGHEDLARRTARAHDEVRDLDQQLEALRRLAREGRRRADYLRFTSNEIAEAALQPAEDEALDAEARRLTHSEELIELSGGLHQRLYEAEDSILDRLSEVGRRLDALIAIDRAASPFRDLHEAAIRNVEELGQSLAPYRDSIEHDPRRLDEIRARQDLLYRLKRKYGDSLEEVIKVGEDALRELEQLGGAGDEIARLEAAREGAGAKLTRLAADLTRRRTAAARTLSEAAAASLPELGLQGGRLQVQLRPHRPSASLDPTAGPANPGTPAGSVSPDAPVDSAGRPADPGIPTGPAGTPADSGDRSADACGDSSPGNDPPPSDPSAPPANTSGTDAIRRTGAEGVEFLVSLNPGFPLAPLRRVASGGEMSRLMLALETALIEIDDLPVLLFDEIDAGIGGRVAHRVADRLVRLAAGRQVFVVTHLAQIAARADRHYSVGKATRAGTTRTTVQVLEGSDRVREVARMLGGDPASQTSRAHARELLADRRPDEQEPD